MVEHRGLEPLTPTLPVWCAPNCANAPWIQHNYCITKFSFCQDLILCEIPCFPQMFYSPNLHSRKYLYSSVLTGLSYSSLTVFSIHFSFWELFAA